VFVIALVAINWANRHYNCNFSNKGFDL